MKDIKNCLLIVSIVFVFSCKKENIVCAGNCGFVNVSGYLFDKVANTNAAVAPVSLKWVKFVGLFSQQRNITSVQAKNDGTFSFSPSVDTTLFNQGYYLALSIPDNNSYITLPDVGLYPRPTMSDYNSNGFANLKIDVYPKVFLKIKLNRIESDAFTNFQISYYFVDNAEYYAFGATSPGAVSKKELNVPTSADLYTKIRVSKTNGAGVSTMTIDSVKCTSNGANNFTVTF